MLDQPSGGHHPSMLSLNDPDVITEITLLHDAYERALIAHDVAALDSAFWDSPDVVRFGVSEHLYGSSAIAAYRTGFAPVLANRRITRRTITAFGDQFASVMCELAQTVGGQLRHSRQSQVWVRLPDVGWKIVAAHVSHASFGNTEGWTAYAERTAQILGLPIEPSHLTGVVQNLERAATLASSLMEFTLPEDIGIAPVFTP
jgi:hypothetical protein